jgi:hypothetical protein
VDGDSAHGKTADRDFVLGEHSMQDVVWILVTIAFFALSIAYVQFCERVK